MTMIEFSRSRMLKCV